MSLNWYTGQGPTGGAAPKLPPPLASSFSAPAAYRPSADLVDAVNVALALGQPLLLTGEPGCGKTQLASHLSWSLGLPLVKYETKSDSTSGGLFYEYDALRHYQASTFGAGNDRIEDYIRLAPLGAAIMRTLPADQRHGLDASDSPAAPGRSVVLIDELDKAPRDFPNDLLNEIDQLYFRIPELGLTIEADRDMQPIIVITSNQERDLPGPFLRRCVYHHVAFPDEDTTREIVAAHLGQLPKTYVDDSLRAFSVLRSDQTGLDRKPGLSELLAWLAILLRRSVSPEQLAIEDALGTAGVVAKTTDDLKRTEQALRSWDRNRQADRP